MRRLCLCPNHIPLMSGEPLASPWGALQRVISSYHSHVLFPPGQAVARPLFPIGSRVSPDPDPISHWSGHGFYRGCLSHISNRFHARVARKGPLQCKRCQRFGHTQRNCGCAPRCLACGDEHPSGKCDTPKQQLKCCSCGGNHTANYRGCSVAKAADAKRARGERSRKDGVSTRLPAPKSAPAKPSPEQEKLGPGWNHVVRDGRVVKAQATPSITSTSSDIGRRTERQAAPTGGQRKPACPEVSVVESQPPRSKQTDSTPSPPQGQSPLQEIADLLENLPTKACVELTRRLLSASSSLPTGEARPRAVIRTVILFIAEYGCAA
jgi:hypothetical protein